MEDKLHSLEQIDAERNDLITKLSKIEEKRSTVSFEVYEKVKREYERKLKAIEEKLASNVELVKTEMVRLKKNEQEIVEQQKDVDLQIEETELRYSIGEYNDDDYSRIMDEIKEKTKKIKDQQAKIHDRVKWFESFSGQTDQHDEKKEKEPEPVMEPEAVVDMAEIKEEVAIVKEEPTEQVAPEPPKEKEEQNALKIDEHILEATIPEQVKKLDELLVEEEAVKEPVKAEPPKSNESAKLKKGEKGVACPKCGYINAPDSWYCEKCGAEILEGPPA